MPSVCISCLEGDRRANICLYFASFVQNVSDAPLRPRCVLDGMGCPPDFCPSAVAYPRAQNRVRMTLPAGNALTHKLISDVIADEALVECKSVRTWRHLFANPPPVERRVWQREIAGPSRGFGSRKSRTRDQRAATALPPQL
jgi:hypothetical protein